MLFIGPVEAAEGDAAGTVGGLHFALSDLLDELEARGWHVDVIGGPRRASSPGSSRAASELRRVASHSQLQMFQRWQLAHRLWRSVPLRLRHQISAYFMPVHVLEHASHNLAVIERALAESDRYDLVFMCVDGIAPGAVALAVDRHPRVALLSLDALAVQLAQWPGLRWLTHRRSGQPLHPALYAPVPIDRVRRAIFPSVAWQQDAVAAGLPASATRVAYFGIPTPPAPQRPAGSRGRLLWVGRLAPEKGLHVFLEALPEIRRRMPEATLTVVAVPGRAPYRALIEKLIRRHRLADVVRFQPPVPRDELPRLYATHDVLLFHSKYAEPVALVMMEAMAAGLPVVAPRSKDNGLFIRDGETCLCYDPGNLESLVAAVLRLHDDASLRQTLSARAQRLIRESYSREATGGIYNQLLVELVDG
jgi:glycosyltransferase involved in cell wall biosynthesis